MCVCCVCIYVSMHYYITIMICDKISSTDTSNKQLYMTCGYIEWWTIGSDQFCWGARAKKIVLKSPKKLPWSSMSPTTWVTIFNRSPYLQLENAKLNLPNFTITSSLIIAN